MSFKNTIATKEIFDFKENYCDENETIVRLLKNDLREYLIPPILDVGAGIGDISYKALSDKKVIMIDVNNISEDYYPYNPKHIRQQCDFFDYNKKGKINTILISHTLQFIDDNLDRLNNKIKELAPKNIVLVLNTNTDFIGELIQWSEEHFKMPNPETRIPLFPAGYKLVKSLPFTAKLQCPNFKILAKQIAYLMLVELGKKENTLITFLKKKLHQPQFIFNQSIDIYQQL